jgi:hypothetical protein
MMVVTFNSLEKKLLAEKICLGVGRKISKCENYNIFRVKKRQFK